MTLVTLALAIAAGWALFQVARGISELISTLLIDYPRQTDLFLLCPPLRAAYPPPHEAVA